LCVVGILLSVWARFYGFVSWFSFFLISLFFFYICVLLCVCVSLCWKLPSLGSNVCIFYHVVLELGFVVVSVFVFLILSSGSKSLDVFFLLLIIGKGVLAVLFFLHFVLSCFHTYIVCFADCCLSWISIIFSGLFCTVLL